MSYIDEMNICYCHKPFTRMKTIGIDILTLWILGNAWLDFIGVFCKMSILFLQNACRVSNK